MTGPDHSAPITVVGLLGEPFGASARAALAEATVVVGSPRQLALLAQLLPVPAGSTGPTGSTGSAGRPRPPEHLVLQGPLDALLAQIEGRVAAGAQVCVLASGDPGFFGIVSALGRRFGHASLKVHPAPSSVSMAFARIGMAWDDAVVVSAHGRPLASALRAVQGPKVAVLTSPDHPPQVIGAALLQQEHEARDVVVASHLGEDQEQVVCTDLAGLAAGKFDPMSVVLLLARQPAAHLPQLSWGLAEEAFAHRAGMITKAEVRAIALSKLALPSSGVLWDVGTGSGSVAVECARLRPELQVVAVDRRPEEVSRAAANAHAHGVAVEAVCGQAPEVLASLPDPDRVFVGGGGLEVLDAALHRLRPGGIVVATYALVDRAAAAADRLGNLVQISVARGVPVGGIGTRLDAENPVFICWGPVGRSRPCG